MPCTPTCAAPRQVPGDAQSFLVRKLSRDLIAPPGMVPPAGAPGVPIVKSNFKAYAMKAATDPDVARVVAALKDGTDPETGDSLCGPTYGCAVRVEKEAAAPRDFTGPLWVVGAVVAGGILRRRRRKPSAS